MINEELFQKVLANRSKLTHKGARINTKVAVSRLRITIENLVAKGYVEDDIMNLMLKESWIGVREHWLQGKLRTPDLSANKGVSDACSDLFKNTRVPLPNYRGKLQKEAVVRAECSLAAEIGDVSIARGAIEEMRGLLSGS